MKKSATINSSNFKAYDIRGIYPTDLNENVAYRVGQAYSQLLQQENPHQKLKVVVGQDMRLSSPSLKKSLINGLTNSGLDVVDIGLVTTPTFYFAVAFYKHDGGIQVSASHNPKDYNGFKLTRARAVPISGETGIMEIKDAVIKNKFPSVKNKGQVSQLKQVTQKTVEVQRKGINWHGIKPLKIVVDAANAMGAVDIEAIFKDLPCKLIKLNFKLDGSFPAHQADPLKEENLAPLQKEVIKQKADLGITPDGDGDRYFFVDEKGQIVRQEILRGLMAQLALKDHPGATVCYDIRPGRITRDMIEAAGGKPVVTRVGHSLIKEKMIQVGAVFGGESSGHYFYKLPYGTFEAPVILILKFLKFISDQDKPLSQIIKPYQKYFHSGEINSRVKDGQTVIKKIAQKYSDANLSYLDGITVEYNDFWFNVRPSNTEPLVRLNLEAISKAKMEQKRDEVLKLIKS
jgi:phosphomannomutase